MPEQLPLANVPSPLDLIRISLATRLINHSDLKFGSAAELQMVTTPKLREAFKRALHIFKVASDVLNNPGGDLVAESELTDEAMAITLLWQYNLSEDTLPLEEARKMLRYKTEGGLLRELKKYGYFPNGIEIPRTVLERFVELKAIFKRQQAELRKKRQRARGKGKIFLH